MGHMNVLRRKITPNNSFRVGRGIARFSTSAVRRKLRVIARDHLSSDVMLRPFGAKI